MKQTKFMEKYPIYTLEVNWSETKCRNIDEVCAYFVNKIDEHPKATYIAIFDHYAHTKSLSDGEIAPEIKDAKNIIFCFGPKIPNPEVIAVRPRSIGVCDLGDRFVISYLEAPAENINQIIEQWVLGLKNVKCNTGS